MDKQLHHIDLGHINFADKWLGEWYWNSGQLAVESDGSIENPESNACFVLSGLIYRIAYNSAAMNSQSLTIEFDDPIELAMKLSDYRLVNADKLIKTVKRAINEGT